MGTSKSEQIGASSTRLHVPTYNTWYGMLRRCFDEDHDSYEDYGGRGITVCDKWLDIDGFIEDMGIRPDGMTLDRINCDGDYIEPNARWATPQQQARNKRNSIYWDINGTPIHLIDISESTGVPYKVLWNRVYQYGWTIERAIGTPVNRRQP